VLISKDLWLKNTYYNTEDTFPTIHRRSQIIRKDVKESHPIENALKTIQEKNKELEEFNSKFANDSEQLQRFTMVLKGLQQLLENSYLL
jgi:DNA-binding transcriptional regulator GbsR (MarR family)